MAFEVRKSDEDWKHELTLEQYRVTREKGTEPPFTGEYNDFKGEGTYYCVACGNALFRSSEKYDSGSGWPSFWAPFSEESIATEVDDSMGLMYGIQSTDTYYRVSIDVQRSFARLVRVDGDLFTVLAEDLNFAPPEASWYTLAVERDGDTHNVYFDGQPLLTATDAAYGSGSIALYCYGMDDGRFDNVGLYP